MQPVWRIAPLKLQGAKSLIYLADSLTELLSPSTG